MLEFGQLLKVFFAGSGSTAAALAALAAAQDWAWDRCQESLVIGERDAQGRGPFPERVAVLQLTSRFLTGFCLLAGDWAAWATEIVAGWPDDPRQASPDPAVLTETIRPASASSQRQRGRLPAGAAKENAK